MLLALHILLPLIAGLVLTTLKNEKKLGFIGTFISGYLTIFTLFILFANVPIDKEVIQPWFKFGDTQTYIALSIDGLGGIMVLMTNLVYTLLFLYSSTIKKEYSNKFYGLLLLAYAGLNGVFMAQDLVLFYFFWEIVLIPMYFLIGIWGANRTERIRANNTFFIFTVFGSFLMLAGIIFIGFNLKPESFLLTDVKKVSVAYDNMSTLAML